MTRPTAEWHHGESGPALEVHYQREQGENPKVRQVVDEPTWTAEPPTEPGDYWFLMGRKRWSSPRTQVAHVISTGFILVTGYVSWEEYGQWSGCFWHPVPLKPPEAP